MKELYSLLHKTSLSEEEQNKMKRLREDIDNLYFPIAKGAFIISRAKWSKERKILVIFCFRETNRKRNNIVSLTINDNINNVPSDISKYVCSFYSNIDFQINDCEKSFTLIQSFTPSISAQFQKDWEEPITKLELLETIYE